jgi:molybdopterin molybdotransferase
LENIFPEEAVEEIIRKKPGLRKKVSVDVPRALGLFLAEDVYAERDNPPFNISRMDGFAVKHDDIRKASPQEPVSLKIIEGDPRRGERIVLSHGQAFYVDTGFPIPEGADAVVPIEEAVVKDNRVLIKRSVGRGGNIVARGSVYSRGELVSKAGVRITGVKLRAFLDAGVDDVVVYDPPKIALHPVGDELIEAWEERKEPKVVREGTQYIIKQVLENYPYAMVLNRLLPDDPEEIGRVLETDIKLFKPDIIVTISGSSIGRKDFSWRSLRLSDNPIYSFKGLRMAPGRTTKGSAYKETILLNLPGFVQATLFSAIMVLQPLIRYANGLDPSPCLPCKKLRNHSRVLIDEADRGKWNMLLGRVNGNEVYVQKRVRRSIIKELARNPGLLILEPEKSFVEAGEIVKTYFLGGNGFLCSIRK